MKNYRITDGGALKVRPGWKKAIPEFAPSSAVHEGFEKQAQAVFKNGQLISFYESAGVENGNVVLSDFIAAYDMRLAVSRAAVNAYDECFFLIGETPYKYTKSTTATAVSGGTVCYVYGKPLTVDKGIVGLWSGTVAGNEVMLFARDNMLYSQQFDDNGEATVTTEIGGVDTTEHVEIFFFGDKVYILDGTNYYSWDGAEFKTVVGYVPTVAVAVSPDGDGTLLEQFNMLSPYFWVKFSGNGTATDYKFDAGASVVLATQVL